MKTSLIMTLKNEKSTILELLSSIVNQSKKPDELIIVDGGSVDNTVDIIKNFMHNKKIPTRIIIKKNTNIAQGRNIAIKNAKYDIIAVTDGSCILEKNWLKYITETFRKDKNLEVVFGLYKVTGKSLIGKCLAGFFNYKLNTQNITLLEISSRSVAFKKTAWAKVKGYPEWLYTAEDSTFFINLKRECKCTISKNAIVFWSHNRETISKLYKMLYLYGKGAGEANIYFNRHLLLLFLYIGGFSLFLCGIKYSFLFPISIILALIYLSRASVFVFNEVNSYKVFFIMPVILLVRDFGLIYGHLNGWFTFKWLFNEGFPTTKYKK